MALPPDLVDLYHRCTARIDIGADVRYGTAFFVAPGRLITCAHVIGEDGSPEALGVYYQGKTYGASVVRLIPPTPPGVESFPDIAILATDFIDHPCAYLDSKSNPRELLYTFGYTGRTKYGESVTAKVDGFAVQSSNSAERLIKFTQAQVIGGLSGAPLLNEKTRSVCGMVNRTLGQGSDLGGLAVPAERILGSLAGEGVQVQRWHDEHPVWLAFVRGAPKRKVAASAVFVVPRTVNHFFIGRDALLAQLRDQLTAVGRVGLVGLGGVGKTQAAVQYAYRYRDEYRNVLWVAADDADTLTKSFIALAKPLGLQQSKISDDNEIVAAVLRWLESNRNWLLVVDNADAPASIARLLPNQSGSHILVTSRRHDLGALNVERSLDVLPLESEDAATFLLRRTNRSDNRERMDANHVAALLGNLPLALEQAGAHVLASGASLAEYAENLRRGGLTALDAGRAETADYRKTVATTWRYAFAAIEDVPTARDLLQLSAFLNSDDIPLELFEQSGKVASPAIASAMVEWDPAIVVNHMLEPLVDYSLISRDVVRRGFAVHRLVQQAIRARMSAQEKTAWTERAIELVTNRLPEFRFKDWEINNRLLPHVQTLAALITQYGVVSPAASTMLDHAGTYLFYRARLTDALPLLEQGLDLRQRLFGPNDPAVAQSLTHLANVHRDRARYDLAAPLYRRALVIRRRHLPNSSELSSTLVNMAIMLEELGKYADAERYYREALAMQRAIPVRDDFRLADVLNNFALLLDVRGHFSEAFRLHNRALGIRRAHKDDEPLEYAQSLNNIGRHYVEREMYSKAAPYFAEALPIFRKYLDPTHPDVITVTYNTALIADSEHDDAKAEELYRWSIDAWTKAFGDTYYDLVLAYNSVGALCAKIGRTQEAHTAYRQALSIITRIAGPRHPNASMIRENLRRLDGDVPKRLANLHAGGAKRATLRHHPVRKAGALHGRKASTRKKRPARARRRAGRTSAVGRHSSPPAAPA